MLCYYNVTNASNIGSFSCMGLETMIVADPDSKVTIAQHIARCPTGRLCISSQTAVGQQKREFSSVPLIYENHRFGVDKPADWSLVCH